jgi:excisionase family DNA binding protein
MANAAQYLTVKQACERLQLSRDTIMAYIRDGRLEATKLVRQWRISAASVERLLRGGE